eukprot:scaffold22288_cov153-Skeletonema_dohrnii-CCMP3373.AAC.4
MEPNCIPLHISGKSTLYPRLFPHFRISYWESKHCGMRNAEGSNRLFSLLSCCNFIQRGLPTGSSWINTNVSLRPAHVFSATFYQQASKILLTMDHHDHALLPPHTQ